MSKIFKVLEDNDSKLVHQASREMKMSLRKLSTLMGCSNAIYLWSSGYRKIPRSFKRFFIVLRFVQSRGLMADLRQFIRDEERTHRKTKAY